MLGGKWCRVAPDGRRPGVGELSKTLIREAFRQMVAFVVVESDRGGSVSRLPKGTAFFVKVPLNEQAEQRYVVTARHVVEGARAAGSMYLRLNVVSGGFEDVSVDPDAWLISSVNDVAVARFDLSRDKYVFTAYPIRWFLTGDEAESREVGHGDDLFFVGLFTQHPGRTSAEPIVRFGNIALMPGEPVKMRDPSGTVSELRAYLAETRSWGGNSGSPCFIYFPSHRYGGVWMQPIETPGGVMTDEIYAEATMPRLLGLVAGHFNVRQDIAFAYDETSEDLAVNSGMAIVVPTEELIDLLMDESLMEERRMTADELRNEEPVASADVADEAESDFDRFEDLTRKLVNTPKEAIDEKKRDAD
jgi:hypothetical protein